MNTELLIPSTDALVISANLKPNIESNLINREEELLTDPETVGVFSVTESLQEIPNLFPFGSRPDDFIDNTLDSLNTSHVALASGSDPFRILHIPQLGVDRGNLAMKDVVINRMPETSGNDRSLNLGNLFTKLNYEKKFDLSENREDLCRVLNIPIDIQERRGMFSFEEYLTSGHENNHSLAALSLNYLPNISISRSGDSLGHMKIFGEVDNISFSIIAAAGALHTGITRPEGYGNDLIQLRESDGLKEEDALREAELILDMFNLESVSGDSDKKYLFKQKLAEITAAVKFLDPTKFLQAIRLAELEVREEIGISVDTSSELLNRFKDVVSSPDYVKALVSGKETTIWTLITKFGIKLEDVVKREADKGIKCAVCGITDGHRKSCQALFVSTDLIGGEVVSLDESGEEQEHMLNESKVVFIADYFKNIKKIEEVA